MKKLSKKSKTIEQEVLQNYKINSPSKLPLENKSYLNVSDNFTYICWTLAVSE